jgi:hypothetical protein
MEGLTGLLEALQNSGFATALRMSGIVYPLVNGTHIVGIALLFGAITALDLRLIGFFPSLPAAPLARLLVPVAATGLVIALTTGMLLFSVNAVKYAGLPVFWLKLSLIAAGTVNALLLHRTSAWASVLGPAAAKPRTRVAITAVLSILLWLSALFCGRFIAYFT